MWLFKIMFAALCNKVDSNKENLYNFNFVFTAQLFSVFTELLFSSILQVSSKFCFFFLLTDSFLTYFFKTCIF